MNTYRDISTDMIIHMHMHTFIMHMYHRITCPVLLKLSYTSESSLSTCNTALILVPYTNGIYCLLCFSGIDSRTRFISALYGKFDVIKACAYT